ncbi:MAG: hydroxymethylglutaryl-CoA reductase, degradative [Chloroflexi bacterium]|nr:hydroxymethylglutaryl-CoA reductase, degradative [Chloroflexota bacterium]
MTRTSRLPGFYKQTPEERASIVARWADLAADELALFSDPTSALPLSLADKLVENVVGTYGLPFAIAANFQVNGRDVLVPMVVEEPSVVAAASYMAKLARAGGGFQTSSDDPVMIGQVQLLDLPDLDEAAETILAKKDDLLSVVASIHPRLIDRGGGPRDLQVRRFAASPVGAMLVVHLHLDCRDAMGANMINSACEALATPLEQMTGGRAALRILSNLADRRLAKAECRIPAESLAFEGHSGEHVVDRIIEAWAFASIDPYRAATHNKGIMNGIDPVIVATGNDWRAIEAGTHAYAARDGQYSSLSQWRKADNGDLLGSLELPMAVGIVGGTTRAHPVAQIALKILAVQRATELAEIATAVGLAQNLAAMRALATEGIQRGHMSLHARQVALAAGATDAQVDQVAAHLIADQKISLAHAQHIVSQLTTDQEKET